MVKVMMKTMMIVSVRSWLARELSELWGRSLRCLEGVVERLRSGGNSGYCFRCIGTGGYKKHSDVYSF